MKQKQKFIDFVRINIMKQIREGLADANRKLIEQEISHYEYNSSFLFMKEEEQTTVNKEELDSDKDHQSLVTPAGPSPLNINQNQTSVKTRKQSVDLETKPLFSQQFATLQEHIKFEGENLTDEEENLDLDKSEQLEPHQTNTFNAGTSNRTQTKNAVTEYNLNVNLEHLTNQQTSPKTEAIFQQFGDRESIDIRNLNNSESTRQLEQLMIQSLKMKKARHVNELMPTRRQAVEPFLAGNKKRSHERKSKSKKRSKSGNKMVAKLTKYGNAKASYKDRHTGYLPH